MNGELEILLKFLIVYSSWFYEFEYITNISYMYDKHLLLILTFGALTSRKRQIRTFFI